MPLSQPAARPHWDLRRPCSTGHYKSRCRHPGPRGGCSSHPARCKGGRSPDEFSLLVPSSPSCPDVCLSVQGRVRFPPCLVTLNAGEAGTSSPYADGQYRDRPGLCFLMGKAQDPPADPRLAQLPPPAPPQLGPHSASPHRTRQRCWYTPGDIHRLQPGNHHPTAPRQVEVSKRAITHLSPKSTLGPPRSRPLRSGSSHPKSTRPLLESGAGDRCWQYRGKDTRRSHSTSRQACGRDVPSQGVVRVTERGGLRPAVRLVRLSIASPPAYPGGAHPPTPYCPCPPSQSTAPPSPCCGHSRGRLENRKLPPA